jgi:hypothetical protein
MPAANSTLEDILFPAVVLAEKEEEGEEGKGQGVGPSVYENAGGPGSRLGWSVPLQIFVGQKNVRRAAWWQICLWLHHSKNADSFT